MENIQLALLLEELALLLELTGVEAFKTRAYRRAAKSIQNLPEDVRLLHANNALRQIPGVGAGIAAKIDEWLRTGSIREQEELKSQFPPVLLELARIPGIGVKTARQLHETLGVTSLDDLARHLREGTIRQVPKLGPQAVARIQRGVEYHLQHRGRVLLAVAVLLERHLGDFCRRIPGVSRVEPTGALRRRRPLLTRVELLVAAEDPSGFWEEIEDYPSLDGAPNGMAVQSTYRPKAWSLKSRLSHRSSFPSVGMRLLEAPVIWPRWPKWRRNGESPFPMARALPLPRAKRGQLLWRRTFTTVLAYRGFPRNCAKGGKKWPKLWRENCRILSNVAISRRFAPSFPLQ